MCDHCGCRQGAIGELMDQHEAISALGRQIREQAAAGDEADARVTLDALLELLEPHVAWEEAGLFARMNRQGDFASHADVLELEHLELFSGLDAAADDPDGWGAAVIRLLEELDRHIYRENFGLFPAAISVLDADDWDAVEAARPLPLSE